MSRPNANTRAAIARKRARADRKAIQRMTGLGDMPTAMACDAARRDILQPLKSPVLCTLGRASTGGVSDFKATTHKGRALKGRLAYRNL